MIRSYMHARLLPRLPGKNSRRRDRSDLASFSTSGPTVRLMEPDHDSRRRSLPRHEPAQPVAAAGRCGCRHVGQLLVVRSQRPRAGRVRRPQARTFVRSRHPDPRRDRGPVPRRRIERAERVVGERRRATATSRRASARRRGPPKAFRQPSSSPARHEERFRSACRAPPCTCGTAIARGATRSTPTASPRRTTCAASRSPDADGVVTFETIFPACYSGRWPHIHFEIYPTRRRDERRRHDRDLAGRAPDRGCNTVFATDGYEQSVANSRSCRLTSDMVFGDDGGVRELATVTGDTSTGYTIALTVPV